MSVWRNSVAVLFLSAAAAMLAADESDMGGGGSMSENSAKPEVSLGFEYFPRRDETALRLLASRPEMGLAFKFHCFEVGPFHEGTAEKRPDGSVVFTYESGEMKCVTTFTPRLGGRVEMDIHVQVDPDLTVHHGHDIAHDVRNRVQESCPDVTSAIVHIEPAEGD